MEAAAEQIKAALPILELLPKVTKHMTCSVCGKTGQYQFIKGMEPRGKELELLLSKCPDCWGEETVYPVLKQSKRKDDGDDETVTVTE